MTALSNAKKTSQQDWHPADVVAALRKRGLSLRQLAMLNGYSNGNSIGHALRRPYPLVEGIIAEALELKPEVIWPTRYGPDGKPNRGPGGPKPMLPANLKPSRLRRGRNPQKAVA